MTTRYSPIPAPSDEGRVETIGFGCPMLIRAAADHPVHSGDILMRCALGWSIRDDLDCARCAATNAVQDCWRVHPERTPVVSVEDQIGRVDQQPAWHAAD
jgi:hypothetical protein